MAVFLGALLGVTCPVRVRSLDVHFVAVALGHLDVLAHLPQLDVCVVHHNQGHVLLHRLRCAKLVLLVVLSDLGAVEYILSIDLEEVVGGVNYPTARLCELLGFVALPGARDASHNDELPRLFARLHQ